MSLRMKILLFNNNPRQTNFGVRLFRTYSSLGPLECNGQELGEVYRDFHIAPNRRFHVVRLLKKTTDEVIARFLVFKRKDAIILEDRLRRAVECAKTTEGNPVKFQYIRNEPHFIIEEQAS